MRKPFCFSLFPLLAIVVFLLAVCTAFPEISMASEAPGVSFETQETAPAAEPERVNPPPAKKQVVHPEVPRIPADQVKEMLAKKADFVIVDTNPPDYYEMWHIPTAVNIPYVSMMDNPDKREDMLATLPKDKLIVIYCLCEEGADSSEMALILRGMDYRRDRVKVLEGGLVQWDAKGYPMIKQEIPE